GVILAGAGRRVPVALDGFIAGAAALVAVTLAPPARHALFASHRSSEPGHGLALKHLGLTPYLDLGLRLGEGTGAALFVHLVRAAGAIYSGLATFKSARRGRGAGRRAVRPSRARGGRDLLRHGHLQIGRRGRAGMSARVVVVAGVASGV